MTARPINYLLRRAAAPRVKVRSLALRGIDPSLRSHRVHEIFVTEHFNFPRFV